MTVRVRQVERTTQPQEAVGVAWENPLSSNLSAQYLITGHGITECVLRKDVAATFSGAGTTSTGPLGIGVKASAYGSNASNGDYISIPSSPENSLSQPISWEVLLTVGTLTVGAFPYLSGILAKYAPAGAGPVLRFNSDATTGNYNVPAFIAADGSGETAVNGSAVNSGDLLHLIGTFDGTTAVLYQNGNKYTQTGARTLSTGAVNPLAVNTDYLGDSGNLTRSSDHLIYYVRIWREAVNDAKASALYANPWQLFEPEQIVVKAATTAYTLTAATASFTLTGNASGLAAQRKLVAATASYTETGNATALTAQRKLALAAGAFTLTGNDATIGRVFSAGTGAFTLTGYDVNLATTGTVVVGGGLKPAGRPSKTRRRRIEIDGRVYDVPERDLPAFIDSLIQARSVPASVEVTVDQKPETGAQQAVAPEVRLPPRGETPESLQARADALRVHLMKQQADRALLVLIDRTIARLMAEIEDEEEAAIALLLH